MSCFCYSHFFSKNIGIYAIFNDQSFNDTLTNDVSFEQLGPGAFLQTVLFEMRFALKKINLSNRSVDNVGNSGTRSREDE